MNQFKLKYLFLPFCLILIFSLQVFTQNKIICNETSEGAGYGSTYIEYNDFKLKTIRGKGFYPDETPVRVIVEIFNDTSNKNKIEERPTAWKIISDENRITACESDENGNFEIQGLKDGFYILKIGNNKEDGFGPVYVFVEISQKKGKKRILEIELGDQI